MQNRRVRITLPFGNIQYIGVVIFEKDNYLVLRQESKTKMAQIGAATYYNKVFNTNFVTVEELLPCDIKVGDFISLAYENDNSYTDVIYEITKIDKDGSVLAKEFPRKFQESSDHETKTLFKYGKKQKYRIEKVPQEVVDFVKSITYYE